jgi:nickel/cobalt exporter
MLEVLIDLQVSLRSVLAGNVAAFAENRSWLALLALLPLGIVFGAAHALAPGHGKMVLATYAVGSDLSRWRIIATAVALTVTHVGMAVLLAVVTNTLVTRTIVGAGRAPALEAISQGLLVLVGLWLIVRAALGRPHAHGEGIVAGIVAGLIPCPLTLFLMFYAISIGVPEAGLTFALAMVVGVGLVLASIAVGSVWARDSLLWVIETRGPSLATISRLIDGAAGVLLLVLATIQLLTSAR